MEDEDTEGYVLLRSPETTEAFLENGLIFTGAGFSMGIIGGSAFHFLKSLCKSPTQIATACHAVRLNAPGVGSNVAAWCSVYSAVQYAMFAARHKTDPWSRVLPAAISTGLLSLCRRSVRASAGLGIVAGLLFSVPDVANIMVDKSKADRKHQKMCLRKAGEGCNLQYGRDVIGQSHMCTNGRRYMPTVYRAIYSHCSTRAGIIHPSRGYPTWSDRVALLLPGQTSSNTTSKDAQSYITKADYLWKH